jgi:hypothetical protein
VHFSSIEDIAVDVYRTTLTNFATLQRLIRPVAIVVIHMNPP